MSQFLFWKIGKEHESEALNWEREVLAFHFSYTALGKSFNLPGLLILSLKMQVCLGQLLPHLLRQELLTMPGAFIAPSSETAPSRRDCAQTADGETAVPVNRLQALRSSPGSLAPKQSVGFFSSPILHKIYNF